MNRRNEKKELRVTVRINGAMQSKVDGMCKEKGLTRGEIIRDALCKYFDDNIGVLSILHIAIEKVQRSVEKLELKQNLMNAKLDKFFERYFSDNERLNLSENEKQMLNEKGKKERKAFVNEVVNDMSKNEIDLVNEILLKFTK